MVRIVETGHQVWTESWRLPQIKGICRYGKKIHFCRCTFWVRAAGYFWLPSSVVPCGGHNYVARMDRLNKYRNLKLFWCTYEHLNLSYKHVHIVTKNYCWAYKYSGNAENMTSCLICNYVSKVSNISEHEIQQDIWCSWTVSYYCPLQSNSVYIHHWVIASISASKIFNMVTFISVKVPNNACVTVKFY